MKNENLVIKPDVYERVTARIVEAIERGVKDWQMPWHFTDAERFSPVNVLSKRRYRGVNVLLLWAIAEERGYESGLWGTYKQWQGLGAQVRKGEQSALVVFWKTSERERQGEEHEAEEEQTEESSRRS